MLQVANAAGPYAIFMHPQVWGTLSKVKELPTSAKPVLEWPNSLGTQLPLSIYGVPVYLTSQLGVADTQGTSNTTSSIYVVQPDQMVVVRRQPTDVIAGYNLLSQSAAATGGGVLLAVDGASHFTSDQTAIRATLRCDMVVPGPPLCFLVQRDGGAESPRSGFDGFPLRGLAWRWPPRVPQTRNNENGGHVKGQTSWPAIVPVDRARR